jgi:hypothetical protein
VVERRYMMRGNSAETWLPNNEPVDSTSRLGIPPAL